ncbi:MAG: glycerophosphodiester phosphodiesterase [Candidatus Kerfeldbacteria bacterium CG08_land_8_20_14_0_20_43_14]|uniref:Glycerophosphodiester phosphodiesterase n=1 Tax=Candidatus Kerfeldbacteria bacterium CG08_land_8_20_14_0_20_43_14 TaxID=2014246 RepID=A0A2H0YPY3_9BACT|nr:MAG: glycerophosphodiester phosphodiesterase [Candidatus Kerfeldbacteria bacterium CG08_land_8_20_14_0_20_43_14]
MSKFLKIGHRGACGHEPENTLRSIKKALELSVDMIEFDVYVCKSGGLVVIHDDTVNRTTNGTGYVTEMTFEELRKLDAGKGEKIPTLQEALDLINGKVQVNIELKGVGTALPVAKTINEYTTKHPGVWTPEHFLVSSFNHFELRAFKQAMPGIKIGALICGMLTTRAQFAQDLGAYSVNPSIEFLDQEFVDDAHRRGLKVFVYTVNLPEDIERMKAWGVDGVFSNFPYRL